ncbi:MAG: Ig-like domain-containing protein [Bacteroidales bacterium]|jgi:hypothetical protein|nr:Ig-like domain-containing protein [Bacteroidales bacterium]MDN5349048.1 hypothetical protein [Bacteroidales bacterium]
MKKQFLIFFLLALTSAAMILNGCKKDDDPVDLALTAITASDIDLNGATSPSNVPVNPVITATFNADIDAASATSANIILTQDYDNTNIPVTINVNANKITITPVNALGNGTLYKLELTAGILSTDGKPLAAVNRTFTTTGTFSPAGIVAHWTFEDNANDVVGNYSPSASGVVDIVYNASRNAEAGKAATFNGTTSIIEIPNGDQLINTHDFTISFWVKTNSADITHGHFVMGLGAFYGLQFEIFGGYDGAKFAIQYEMGDGTTAAEDMWFPAEATDASNGGWQGWDFAKSISVDDMMALLKDNWLHVTYVYDAAAKKGTLYYNGEKMKSFDFNLWPEEDIKRTAVGLKYAGQEPDVVNELAFGFIHSRAGTMWDSEPWGGYDFPDANHFKGQLDDIKIFHKVVTATEVSLMYESEKP